MSHKTDISVISQKAPNKKQRKEEIKRSKSHLPTKVIFNLTTKYAVVLVVQSLCRGFSVHGILQARIWSGLPFPSLGSLEKCLFESVIHFSMSIVCFKIGLWVVFIHSVCVLCYLNMWTANNSFYGLLLQGQLIVETSIEPFIYYLN